MKKIIRVIRDFLSKLLEEEQLQFDEWKFDAQDIQSLAYKCFPKAEVFVWDRIFYYIKDENWAQVVSDVLLNMPDYTASRFDCENFALLCASRVSSKYKLNSMGIAIGSNKSGPHGFNVFLTRHDNEAQFMILEPQNGDYYSLEDDSGYEVNKLILG